jgi:hypothetical protein
VKVFITYKIHEDELDGPVIFQGEYREGGKEYGVCDKFINYRGIFGRNVITLGTFLYMILDSYEKVLIREDAEDLIDVYNHTDSLWTITIQLYPDNEPPIFVRAREDGKPI